ncbi:MAG: hypothetical protein GDA43_01715 [Hormoscilla sp. SP5CHS1]|nr:hypothetical protein [Hormoscilla sp. SP5CHS1]
MIYKDLPLIIPVLATAYICVVYLILILAQRGVKWSRRTINRSASLTRSSVR